MSQESQKLREILQRYIMYVNESDNITETLESVIKSLEAEPKTATTEKETFMDRLIKERDELHDKLKKLTSFLDTGNQNVVSKVGDYQYDQLLKQSNLMGEYLIVLNDRIENLSPKTEDSGN